MEAGIKMEEGLEMNGRKLFVRVDRIAYLHICLCGICLFISTSVYVVCIC